MRVQEIVVKFDDETEETFYNFSHVERAESTRITDVSVIYRFAEVKPNDQAGD